MATGQYEMKWRAQHHSTAVNNHRLYSWGGDQKDLPMIHYHDEKRKFTSFVDIFHLPTLKWERRSTTATPPARVMNYACTNIRGSIMYFGGSCKPRDCFHNDLFEFNTLTNEWREIINSSDNGPMRKHRCGMISFNKNGEDNLLVIGGFGPTPTPITADTGFQYIPLPNNSNRCLTDEIHTMCVNSSPGQWKVPNITPNRPPPCADFSINTLPDNRSVMFGGRTIDETGFRRVNDLFLLSFFQNTIDFQKVPDTSRKWPKARYAHASTVINTISSNQQTISHLMALGGLDDDIQTLSDCWIMNLSSFIWYQIKLPDSVTKRFAHSMSTYYISKERFWIVVTGGYSGYNKSKNISTPITGSDITVIIELEYINDEWSVRDVWDYKQLMENKNEIQTNLLDHLLHDRSQELETQRILEKKIFEKESELSNLSVEMRRKSDEITHLKTREKLLIEKGLKVIVGLLAIIGLYFLVSEIVPVFTKSNETGEFIPEDASSILLSHLSDITDVPFFCVYLELESYCDKLRQYNSLNEKKIEMLKKWQDLQRRTWREFIHPFVMLEKCVKAQELAKIYSVYFSNKEELEKCKHINNHAEL